MNLRPQNNVTIIWPNIALTGKYSLFKAFQKIISPWYCNVAFTQTLSNSKRQAPCLITVEFVKMCLIYELPSLVLTLNLSFVNVRGLASSKSSFTQL